MNVLITGADGFIGDYFVNKYNEKYVISKFSFRNDNLDKLDLKNTDTIIHLSALVHQMGGASKEEYERVNVNQTVELAKKAKQSGVKSFIFMSSVKAYGEESDEVYTELTQCNPEDGYGKSKLKAETELHKLEDEDFHVAIVRTPIVYGYGVKANIKNLISLVDKVPVLPFVNTANKRSMVYIGNLCHLVDVLVQKTTYGVFLASDDVSVSTTELIKLIARELNKPIYLLYIPFFETALKMLKPSFHKRLYESLEVDNTYTKTLLQFTNPYSLSEGIYFMIHGDDK